MSNLRLCSTVVQTHQPANQFGGIMLALVDGRPEVLTLKSLLWNYAHRKDVTRRTRYKPEGRRAGSYLGRPGKG